MRAVVQLPLQRHSLLGTRARTTPCPPLSLPHEEARPNPSWLRLATRAFRLCAAQPTKERSGGRKVVKMLGLSLKSEGHH